MKREEIPEGIEVVEPAKRRGGEWVVLGDFAYRVPPLGMLELQELQDDFVNIAGMSKTAMPNGPQLESAFKIIHAAIRRSYPDFPLTEVRELLDLSNTVPVLNTVLTVAGMERGGTVAGEARASIGAGSTQP